MISIEKERRDEKRFLFNRPFNCIKIEFGSSEDILPTLTWDTRTIIWLDYDGTLTKDVISDVRFVTDKLVTGSLLLVSVNSEPERDTNAERGLELLTARIGESNLPVGVTNKDLRKWGTAAVFRKIINNQIQEVISIKNGVRHPSIPPQM
jgi:hypothetical protein